MKKLLKRFGAAFVIVAMLVAMIPMTVLAATYTFYNQKNNNNSYKVSENTVITDKTIYCYKSNSSSGNGWTTFTVKVDGTAQNQRTTEGGYQIPATTTYFVKNINNSTVELSTKFVEFNPNYEGATSSFKAIQKSGNTYYVGNETPTQEGYDFDGWYTQATGGTKVTPNAWNQLEVNNEHTVLYAHWTPKPVVTFNKNEGEGNIPDAQIQEQKKQYGQHDYYYVTTPTAPTKDGYNFVGWFYNSELTSGVVYKEDNTRIKINTYENTTIYAKWTAKPTVTFNMTLGTGIAPANAIIEFQDDYGIYNDYYYVTEPEDPTSEGLEFVAWYYDETLNQPVTSPTQGRLKVKDVDKNGTTFYAKWKSTVNAPTPSDADDLVYNPESDGNALLQAPATAIEGTVVKYAVVEKPLFARQDPTAPADDSEDWVELYEDVKAYNAGHYFVFYKAFEDTMPASDVKSIDVWVTPKEVAAPTALNPTYNGKEQAGVEFAAPIMSTSGDGVMQTNAGPYETVFSLDNNLTPRGHINYVWADETEWPATVAPKTLSWSIEKRDVEENDFVLVTPDEEELGYTGEPVDIEAELKDINLDEFGDVALLVKDANGKEYDSENVYLPGTYKVYAGVTGGNNFVATEEGEEVYVGSFTIDGVKVVAGDKGKFTEGSDGTLTFKANGPFDKDEYEAYVSRELQSSKKFNGIKVDGYSVDPKAYTVEKGSTVATLSNDYLKTLRTGKHTITFVYDGGNVTAEATFTVEAAQVSPKTSDTNTTWLWIFLSVLGGLAIIAGAYKTIGSDL